MTCPGLWLWSQRERLTAYPSGVRCFLPPADELFPPVNRIGAPAPRPTALYSVLNALSGTTFAARLAGIALAAIEDSDKTTVENDTTSASKPPT